MEKEAEIQLYLNKNKIFYDRAINDQRGFLIKRDTLSSVILTKLISLGVHTLTVVSNRGIMEILVEY